MSVIKTDFDACLDLVADLEEKGVKIFICKGEVEHVLSNNTSVIVVPFRNPLTQFYRAIKTAYQFSDTVALVGWYKNIIGLREFCEIINPELFYIEMEEYDIQSNRQNVDHILISLERQGVDAIVGNEIIINSARRLGIPAYNVGLNPQAIFDAVDSANRQLSLLNEQQRRYSFINALLNSVSEGIITVNPELQITDMNRIAADILNTDTDSWKNRPLSNFLKISHIERTMKEGYKIVNQLYSKNGLKLLINVSPIGNYDFNAGAIITLQKTDNLMRIERTIRRMSIEKNMLAKKTFDDIVGRSALIAKTKEVARLFARTSSTVLITGESGVGKELFAQGIHNESNRRSGPFLAFNCGAVSESLLESELFGYVRGAFTGASSEGKAGIFEQAHNGTLFLDEVSELTPSAQLRLLRVLQEKEITRIGDTRVTPIDVRVVAACNKNLWNEVEKGNFRRDLYYRLYVLHLEIPSLRARREDIMELINFFLREQNQSGITFSPEAIQYLSDYPWPGNIRELNNFSERISVLFADQTIELDPACIRPLLQPDTSAAPLQLLPSATCGYIKSRKHLSGDYLIQVLNECGGNKTLAAKRLGISTTTLWRKLKKLEP